MENLVSFLIFAAIFASIWLMLDAFLAFMLFLICKLFGTTPALPAVPNKSVWG